jgi:hypothetical protein
MQNIELAIVSQRVSGRLHNLARLLAKPAPDPLWVANIGSSSALFFVRVELGRVLINAQIAAGYFAVIASFVDQPYN